MINLHKQQGLEGEGAATSEKAENGTQQKPSKWNYLCHWES